MRSVFLCRIAGSKALLGKRNVYRIPLPERRGFLRRKKKETVEVTRGKKRKSDIEELFGQSSQNSNSSTAGKLKRKKPRFKTASINFPTALPWQELGSMCS